MQQMPREYVGDYGDADVFPTRSPPAGGNEWYKSFYRATAISLSQTLFDMGFLCLICVCVLNAGFSAFNFQITHSWFLDTPIGSILRSSRFSAQWWLLAFTHVRAILIWTACFSQTVPQNTFRHLIHIVGGVIVILVDLVLFLILGFSWITCNTDGNPSNMCNDLLYCCVYFTTPANNCPNTIACVPSLGPADLGANSDFLWVFWTTFAALLCDLCIVLPAYILWGSYSYLYSLSSEDSLQGGINEEISSEMTAGSKHRDAPSGFRERRKNKPVAQSRIRIEDKTSGFRERRKEKQKTIHTGVSGGFVVDLSGQQIEYSISGNRDKDL
jgi:hypothetical protein